MILKVCEHCGGEFEAKTARARSCRRFCSTACGQAFWYKANREKVNALGAAWRRANPDKVKANRRSYLVGNREKMNKSTAAWRKTWCAANPEKAKARNRKNALKRYGLSVSGFNALLAAQGGRCAICRTDDPGKRGWCVEHNHDTNEVRGIACSPCNIGVGHFRDDPEVMLRAALYVLLGGAHDPA